MSKKRKNTVLVENAVLSDLGNEIFFFNFLVSQFYYYYFLK